jgi:type I site-specific restriction endonuclease
MLRRTRQHGQQRAGAFPANSRGHELYVSVGASVVSMEKFSAEQAVHAHAYKEKTAQKNVADGALHELMELMSRTARSMSKDFPGAKEKFSLPSKRDGETWLVFARGFSTEVVPLEEEFVRRGMAPDFVDDLKARVHAVDQAGEGQERAWAARIEATAGLAKAAQQGLEDVRELDTIVRNVYKDNETELIAWESASHVERAPRRAVEEEEEPPAQPPPAQS